MSASRSWAVLRNHHRLVERMASIAPAVAPAGDPSEKADMVDSYVFSVTRDR